MNLFLPEKLGTLPLSNHFLRSGVPEGLALKSGAPHARLDEHYLQLIEGQASTIICGPISVTATNQYGLADRMGYICTGGGALIRFLTGEELPVVHALRHAAKAFPVEA